VWTRGCEPIFISTSLTFINTSLSCRCRSRAQAAERKLRRRLMRDRGEVSNPSPHPDACAFLPAPPTHAVACPTYCTCPHTSDAVAHLQCCCCYMPHPHAAAGLHAPACACCYFAPLLAAYACCCMPTPTSLLLLRMLPANKDTCNMKYSATSV
jgi:hypothetical protein